MPITGKELVNLEDLAAAIGSIDTSVDTATPQETIDYLTADSDISIYEKAEGTTFHVVAGRGGADN